MAVGSVEILKGLSFEIDTRAIHCLIGPNGAGKTSALNALTGKLPLAAGDIRWAGDSLAGERVYGTAARGIGRKSQVPSIFPELTIGQNVDIALWANRLRPLDLFRMAPYRWRTPLLERLEARFAFLGDAGQPAGVALGGGAADARLRPHHARRARPRAAGRALRRGSPSRRRRG